MSFSRFLIAPTLAAVVVLTGCSGAAVEAPTEQVTHLPEVRVIEVAPGGAYTFRATGTVEAASIARLTAPARADVAEIFVNVGDTVTANQQLVRLSSDTIATSTSSASASLRAAEQSLAAARAAAQQGITSAQTALDNAERALAQTQTQNVATRSQAKEQLDATKVSVGLGIDAAETALDNAIGAARPTLEAATTTADQIVGVSETYKSANDEYEQYLGALNTATKQAAERAVEMALDSVATMDATYADTLAAARAVEAGLTRTVTLLDATVTSSAYPTTTLTTQRSSVTTQLTAVRGVISSLTSAQAAVASALASTNGTSQTIKNAEAAYAATIAQLAANEDAATRAVTSARAALAAAEEQSRVTIAQAESAVTQARGGASQAGVSAADLTIRAPLAGRVTQLPVKLGDEVAAGTPVVTVEDPATTELVVYLAADAAARLAVGDRVTVGADGSGVITAVSPTADSASRKFKIEIRPEAELTSGTFVPVVFQATAGSGAGIYVPLAAVSLASSGDYVWRVTDGTAMKIPVTIGRVEAGLVEITSGLSMGDRVIVEGGRILETDGVAVNVVD